MTSEQLLPTGNFTASVESKFPKLDSKLCPGSETALTAGQTGSADFSSTLVLFTPILNGSVSYAALISYEYAQLLETKFPHKNIIQL